MSILQIERVLNHSQTRGSARTVLIAVAFHAHDDGSRSHAGLERLAFESGYHRATVARALARIEALGELHPEHRGGRGPRDTTRYTVTIAHAPGRVAGCDASCRREVSQSVAVRVATSRVKGRTVQPEPSGTVNEPSLFDDAPAAPRRKAARQVAHKSARKDAPDSRVAVLLGLFCQTHEATLGTKYLCVGARDAVALKRALATYDEATIRTTLAAFFRDRTSRLRYGAKVTQFVDRIGTLAAAPNPKHHSGSPRTAGNLEAIARGLGLRR
jgi:hypothetical protein